MSSATVFVSLVLLFHLTSVEAKCGKQCYCFLGDKILIPCEITGTYSWPQWMKGNVVITNEGYSHIHPAYAARYSFDTDNQTLIIDKVEKSDAGRYRCYHPKGQFSSDAVEVTVEEPLNACGIKIAIASSLVLALVVIIIHCAILIWTYKKCKQNENKNEDKLKEIKSTKICKNVVQTVLSILILVIAAVLFIILSVWFPLKTEEDCEKLTKMEHSFYVYFLVVEIIVLGLGVINGLVYKYFVRKRKNAPEYKAQYAKRTSDNHVTEGDTASIEDNAEMPITNQLLKELEKEGSVND